MEKSAIKEGTDLWDIINWNKIPKKPLMKKDFYTLEMWVSWMLNKI